MTLEKAIEIIRTFLPPVADGLDPDEIDAIQLGIEALKFGKDYFGESNFLYLLKHQGETKEV